MNKPRANQTDERLALARPLFDPSAGLAVIDPLDTPPAPFATELAGLSPNAVAKRQREFAAGRAAAHAAMTQLGHPPQPIPVGSNRAPVWPNGLTGSISHTLSCAMAVVARSTDMRAIGIDVEEDTPLGDKLLSAICTDNERQWLKLQSNPGQLAKVIFSAKEAAYKCQYTVSQCYLGFHGMELELDLAKGRFQAHFTGALPPFAQNDMIHGRFAVGAGLIVTTAELRS